jgi:segregation and condensation protein A
LAEALESKAQKPAPMDRLWAENADDRMTDDPSLVVDVAGFEGPLDLLLHLARIQRVDLARISILALVEQYLIFVSHGEGAEAGARRRLSGHGGMARLPQVEAPDPQAAGRRGRERRRTGRRAAVPAEAAGSDARCSSRLVNRNRLGRDVFQRGAPEMVIVEKRNAYSASLFDLLSAYAQQRQKQAINNVTIARRGVWSLKDARDILTRLVGESERLDRAGKFSDRYMTSPEERRTAIASSFAATWNWCATARWTCGRTSRSRRSTCAAARRQSRQSRWHHERTRQRFGYPVQGRR